MAGASARGELTLGPATTGGRSDSTYAVAGPNDEAELRELLRETSMGGPMRVSFTREPNYFAGENCLGANDTTIVARRDGRVVCMGRGSVRNLYFTGGVKRVGYLAELRMREGQPGGMELLRGGFRFFREQAHSAPADLYFTSIASANTRAQRVLESGRRFGLPTYRPLGELVTLIAPVSSRGSARGQNAATPLSRAELTEFLGQAARRKNLSLPWNDQTWAALERQDISWQDFVVVRRDNRIVAAAALWDQRPFRQTVIASYQPLLTAVRPIYNLGTACLGRPGLPRPGEPMAQAALLGLTLTEKSAWPDLWRQLSAAAAARKLRWLLWSFDASQLDRVADQKPSGAWVYRSRLYSVQWTDSEDQPCAIEGPGVLAPEVALL